MVGVPGRSKGCNICRKRKIACSLERPQCSQCVRSKRQCTGYQRELVFVVNQAPKDRDQKCVAVTSYRGAQKSPPGNETTPRDYKAHPGSLALAISSRAATRQQLFNAFIAHSPEARQQWLPLLAQSTQLTQALETAMLALSTAKLGRVSQNNSLARESLSIYTRGLRELQTALLNPGLMFKDETFAACLCFSLYEVLECPTESSFGYTSHVNGCEKLLKGRGATRHSGKLAHEAFRSIRYQLILQALEHEQSTFLADPEWMTLPWLTYEKTPLDHVLDVLVVLPGLLQETCTTKHLPRSTAIATASRLWHKACSLVLDMNQLYKEYQSSESELLYWPEISKKYVYDDQQNQENLFPIAYSFTNLDTAAVLMLYWATFSVLWGVMADLHWNMRELTQDMKSEQEERNIAKVFDPSDMKFDDILEVPSFDLRSLTETRIPQIDVRKYAYINACNVCQSIEYFLRDDPQTTGIWVGIVPLVIARVVFQRLGQQEREVEWCGSSLEQLMHGGPRMFQVYKFHWL